MCTPFVPTTFKNTSELTYSWKQESFPKLSQQLPSLTWNFNFPYPTYKLLKSLLI